MCRATVALPYDWIVCRSVEVGSPDIGVPTLTDLPSWYVTMKDLAHISELRFHHFEQKEA